MKLFSTTPPEHPENHHSNLKTGKMFVTPEMIRETLEKSLTPQDFAKRLLQAVDDAQIEILLREVDVD